MRHDEKGRVWLDAHKSSTHSMTTKLRHRQSHAGELGQEMSDGKRAQPRRHHFRSCQTPTRMAERKEGRRADAAQPSMIKRPVLDKVMSSRSLDPEFTNERSPNARAVSISRKQKRSSIFTLPHFRTKNRIPLFLKML